MNDLKRIEIPLWRKCQINCFFCSERELIKFHRGKSLNFNYFTKLLYKAYKKWYNSLTIVWWEPTIEPNFFKAIKFAKSLGMHVQISTNWIKLIDANFVKELSGYIDWLTLSVQCIYDNSCKNILWIPLYNREQKLKKIIENLEKFFLIKPNKEVRTNTVINKKLSVEELQKIINLINSTKINEIHITYPDTDEEIGKKNIKFLTISKQESLEILNKLTLNNKIKLCNFPICFIPQWKRKYVENYNASITKLHIKDDLNIYNRPQIPHRKRKKIDICKSCKYKKICLGFPIIPSKYKIII